MQKIILLLILFVSNFILGQTEKKQDITITVKVLNATSDKGKMLIAIYNEANFLKKPLFGKSSTIKNGKAEVIFNNISKGSYAIVCFHDENNNNLLDFDERGVPKESYGNTGEMAIFEPPTFEKSKILITKNKVVKIKL